MDEWRRGEEVGLIECQTCKKKSMKFLSLNLIILYKFELGFINLSFLLFKNIAYFNLTIRIIFDQCEGLIKEISHSVQVLIQLL